MAAWWVHLSSAFRRVILDVALIVERVWSIGIGSLPHGLSGFQLFEISLHRVFQRLGPELPYILATGAHLVSDSLLSVVVLDGLCAIGVSPRSCPHAQPKVVPMIRARPELAITIDVEELAGEHVAEHGVVEGGLAGHGGWVERVGGDIEGGFHRLGLDTLCR